MPATSLLVINIDSKITLICEKCYHDLDKFSLNYNKMLVNGVGNESVEWKSYFIADVNIHGNT